MTREPQVNTDNMLMSQVRDGRVDRLGTLYERHKAALYRFFYRMTHSRDASEDLVQTVFLRILKYRGQFRGHGKFTTWMYRIATNAGRDHFRRGVNVERAGDERLDRLGCSAPGHEEEAMTAQELSLLDRAMGLLPSDKREVLVLSKIEVLKYREIGEILGCSEGAVKVRICRAMRELREQYRLLEASN